MQPDLPSGMDAKRTAMGSGAKAPVRGLGADSPHDQTVETRARTRDGLRFLRIGSVIDRVGLSRRTLLDLVATGDFPRPVRPSRKTVAWLEPEIDEWMASKIAERDCVA